MTFLVRGGAVRWNVPSNGAPTVTLVAAHSADCEQNCVCQAPSYPPTCKDIMGALQLRMSAGSAVLAAATLCQTKPAAAPASQGSVSQADALSTATAVTAVPSFKASID